MLAGFPVMMSSMVLVMLRVLPVASAEPWLTMIMVPMVSIHVPTYFFLKLS
jgi:hypothetical protein